MVLHFWICCAVQWTLTRIKSGTVTHGLELLLEPRIPLKIDPALYMIFNIKQKWERLLTVASVSFLISALGGSSALHIPAFPSGGCLIDYVPQVCQLLTNKVKYVLLMSFAFVHGDPWCDCFQVYKSVIVYVVQHLPKGVWVCVFMYVCRADATWAYWPASIGCLSALWPPQVDKQICSMNVV